MTEKSKAYNELPSDSEMPAVGRYAKEVEDNYRKAWGDKHPQNDALPEEGLAAQAPDNDDYKWAQHMEEPSEWEKFRAGASNAGYVVGSWIVNTEQYLRARFVALGRGGWRPYFFWVSVTVMMYALSVAFIELPRRGVVLPEYYFMSLLSALGLILGAVGIRGVEKYTERQQSIEQTNRLNVNHH